MSKPQGTILVTGANGGLGSAIVAHIGSTLPNYHTIYAVRDIAAPNPALRSALPAQASFAPEIVSLDLTRLSNVRQVATAINERVARKEIPPIRALVLNAGFQEFQEQTWTEKSEGGFDSSFAANYLGHWLLAVLLLRSLDPQNGRVVFLGSVAHDPHYPIIERHYPDEKWKTFIHENLDAIADGSWSTTAEDPTLNGGFRRSELQKRLRKDPAISKITVVGVDPGTMVTSLVRRNNWLVRNVFHKVILANVARVMYYTTTNPPIRFTQTSARDVMDAAMNSRWQNGGVYLNGSEPGSMSAEARDVEKSAIVWRDSVRYTKLKDGETVLVNWK
ncbi:uncharacterized protein BP5553_09151 [Venustampulla echinocandica]|uniref:3beta-hydroxysteroid 3-dehydrogenase n=1 Tax=Venustampulla echinocandica TaxID=2656787 RepID=A0A370TE07_9HELO|nr:uncharacterized protein BP5553_09151 [Venustampulla echinocandica]RDL32695.1 hypothetical protein BP5553_09151 [Venustampulla echinocandica]